MRTPCKVVVHSTENDRGATLEVLGHRYETYTNPDILGEGLLGTYQGHTDEITFYNLERTQTDLVLHEVLEALRGLCQMEMPHETLSVIAQGMATFLHSIGVGLKLEEV